MMVGVSKFYLANILTAFAELEPRRQRSDQVEILVNLSATLEDHGEVSFISLLFLLYLTEMSIF